MSQTQHHILFRIICRVSEYSDVKATLYSIAALNDNTMFICVHKFIVKKYFPLRMKELSVTMCHEGFGRIFAT